MINAGEARKDSNEVIGDYEQSKFNLYYDKSELIYIARQSSLKNDIELVIKDAIKKGDSFVMFPMHDFESYFKGQEERIHKNIGNYLISQGYRVEWGKHFTDNVNYYKIIQEISW